MPCVREVCYLIKLFRNVYKIFPILFFMTYYVKYLDDVRLLNEKLYMDLVAKASSYGGVCAEYASFVRTGIDIFSNNKNILFNDLMLVVNSVNRAFRVHVPPLGDIPFSEDSLDSLVDEIMRDRPRNK